jgi:hypothetical protein
LPIEREISEAPNEADGSRRSGDGGAPDIRGTAVIRDGAPEDSLRLFRRCIRQIVPPQVLGLREVASGRSINLAPGTAASAATEPCSTGGEFFPREGDAISL